MGFSTGSLDCKKNMKSNRSLPIFLLAGLFSGILCSSGGYWLPEDSFFADSYPGIVLGLALFGLGSFIGVQARDRRILSAVVLVVSSIIGWHLSIDLGFDKGDPLPFTAAGAIGAFSVSLGLLLAWPVIKLRYLFVTVVTLGGAIGGLIFRFTNKLVDDSAENLWVFLLFVEWQIIFLVGIWVAIVYGRCCGELQSNKAPQSDASRRWA